MKRLVSNFQAAIAGVESGFDEKSDDSGDGEHNKENEEASLLKRKATDGVFGHSGVSFVGWESGWTGMESAESAF